MLALAPAPLTPVVHGPNLPAPPEAIYALAPVVLVLLAVSLLVAVQRWRIRRACRRRGGLMASFALSVALGNALVELGSMLTPDRPVAMIMERGDCERTPQGPADGRDPPSGSPVGSLARSSVSSALARSLSPPAP